MEISFTLGILMHWRCSLAGLYRWGYYVCRWEKSWFSRCIVNLIIYVEEEIVLVKEDILVTASIITFVHVGAHLEGQQNLRNRHYIFYQKWRVSMVLTLQNMKLEPSRDLWYYPSPNDALWFTLWMLSDHCVCLHQAVFTWCHTP